VEAFELSAIDYLLKPLGADKVERVISKIKDNIRRNQLLMNEQLKQLEKILKMNSSGHDNKIGIGMADKIVFVNTADILYCEAQGNYTNVVLQDGKKIVASKTLGDFENQFAGRNFFRIHHSYMINMNRVKEFQRYEGGYVILENNTRLEVSQRKRKDFLDAISGLVI
jgi:two-component system LytT family response regulator